jgi:hypothetical protein
LPLSTVIDVQARRGNRHGEAGDDIDQRHQHDQKESRIGQGLENDEFDQAYYENNQRQGMIDYRACIGTGGFENFQI